MMPRACNGEGAEASGTPAEAPPGDRTVPRTNARTTATGIAAVRRIPVWTDIPRVYHGRETIRTLAPSIARGIRRVSDERKAFTTMPPLRAPPEDAREGTYGRPLEGTPRAAGRPTRTLVRRPDRLEPAPQRRGARPGDRGAPRADRLRGGRPRRARDRPRRRGAARVGARGDRGPWGGPPGEARADCGGAARALDRDHYRMAIRGARRRINGYREPHV